MYHPDSKTCWEKNYLDEKSLGGLGRVPSELCRRNCDSRAWMCWGKADHILPLLLQTQPAATIIGFAVFAIIAYHYLIAW